MKKLFLKSIGYIIVTENHGKQTLLNVRSILRYETYTNEFLKHTKTRLYYLDGSFLNLMNTTSEIDSLIF